MLPLSIVLTQTIGISILQAKNMHGFRALVYLCISIVNVFISIYLAGIYGAIGATIGTTLSLIFGNVIVMNFYYHFKVKLNIPRFYKELFRGLLISMIISGALGMTLLLVSNNSWLAILQQAVVYFIIYLFIMWFIGMNSYEKRLFSNEINKFKGKIFSKKRI